MEGKLGDSLIELVFVERLYGERDVYLDFQEDFFRFFSLGVRYVIKMLFYIFQG